MDRRTFLTVGTLLGASALYGNTEEFLRSPIGLEKSPTIIRNLIEKLDTVQHYVGYVKFNTISFDEMLKTAHRCNQALTQKEIGYIESIFYGDPRRYGFYGERTVPRLTSTISPDTLVYIKKSGHFLMKGAAQEKYNEIRRLLGNKVVLTSGVRAPVKQLYLFLNKMVAEGGDLRLTSTCIAPPGFTFHSIGDFDIGKAGYGMANFSDKFQETDVFKKLYDKGYITIRYTPDNPYGVRYEPWHIKVTGGTQTA